MNTAIKYDYDEIINDLGVELNDIKTLIERSMECERLIESLPLKGDVNQGSNVIPIDIDTADAFIALAKQSTPTYDQLGMLEHQLLDEGCYELDKGNDVVITDGKEWSNRLKGGYCVVTYTQQGREYVGMISTPNEHEWVFSRLELVEDKGTGLRVNISDLPYRYVGDTKLSTYIDNANKAFRGILRITSVVEPVK